MNTGQLNKIDLYKEFVIFFFHFVFNCFWKSRVSELPTQKHDPSLLIHFFLLKMGKILTYRNECYETKIHINYDNAYLLHSTVVIVSIKFSIQPLQRAKYVCISLEQLKLLRQCKSHLFFIMGQGEPQTHSP